MVSKDKFVIFLDRSLVDNKEIGKRSVNKLDKEKKIKEIPTNSTESVWRHFTQMFN